MDDGYPMNKDAMVTREEKIWKPHCDYYELDNDFLLFPSKNTHTHTETVIRTHVVKASGFAFMGFSITCLGPDCGL
jgi:hypothetical protein